MRQPDDLDCRATKIAVTICLALLAGGAGAASAPADNCQMQISNTVVDYGATTRAELIKKQISPLMMALGKQTVTLTATCKTPTLMTLFFRGAGADGNAYRLGGGGSFTLRVLNARLDGRSVGLGTVKVATEPPENKGDVQPLPPGVGVVPILNDVPLRGSTLQLQIDIDAMISTTGSRVSDRTVFRGSGNFELQEN